MTQKYIDIKKYDKVLKAVFVGGNISVKEFELEKTSNLNLSEHDMMWKILNKKVQNHMSKNDWERARIAYLDMASFLREEGKDAFNALHGMNKCKLLSLKDLEGFVIGVTIQTMGGCEVCSKLQGKEYTIDDALETNPIPIRECTTQIGNSKKGWCRCSYRPIIKIGNEIKR
mgnify:CR=1 FL=1